MFEAKQVVSDAEIAGWISGRDFAVFEYYNGENSKNKCRVSIRNTLVPAINKESIHLQLMNQCIGDAGLAFVGEQRIVKVVDYDADFVEEDALVRQVQHWQEQPSHTDTSNDGQVRKSPRPFKRTTMDPQLERPSKKNRHNQGKANGSNCIEC